MSLRLHRGVSGCWSGLVSVRALLNAYHWSKEAFRVNKKWVIGVVLLGYSLMIELISPLTLLPTQGFFLTCVIILWTTGLFKLRIVRKLPWNFFQRQSKFVTQILKKQLILFYFIRNGFGTNLFSICIFIFCRIIHLFLPFITLSLDW